MSGTYRSITKQQQLAILETGVMYCVRHNEAVHLMLDYETTAEEPQNLFTPLEWNGKNWKWFVGVLKEENEA